MSRAWFLAAVLVAQAAAASAAQPVAGDATIQRRGAGVLEITTGGAALTLMPSAVGDIRVHADPNGALHASQLQTIRSGKRLSLTVAGPSGTSMVPFATESRVAFQITYPASMKIDVRVSSGNVRVVKPVAGVQVYDQSGDVSIEQPHANVTVEAQSGDVSVDGALAPIDLAADNGNVTAGVASGWSGREIRIQSATGTIHLTLPSGFHGRFDVTSAKGELYNTFGPSNARAPLVWLYAPDAGVWISQSKA